MKNAKVGSTLTLTKGKQFKVKLKAKIRKDTASLFLEYYKGYEQKNGKSVPMTEREYLNRNILRNPKTPIERSENKRLMEWAEKVRMIREQERDYRDEGLLNPEMRKINYIIYMESFRDTRSNSEIRNYTMVCNSFKKFIGKDHIYPKELTERLCEEYKDYIVKRYNGETPQNIFRRFKKMLKMATKDGVFLKNPAQVLKVKIPTGLRKQVLTMEEVMKLSEVKTCPREDVRLAFLFSTCTGLRHVDIKALKWKHVENNFLNKIQEKTGIPVQGQLSSTAVRILNQLDKNTDLVFPDLPCLSYCSRLLKDWVYMTGINKNISWHCARHTFATLLLSNNVDVKTAASLMGHSGLNSIGKYAHVVNELKEKAVKTLPDLDI